MESLQQMHHHVQNLVMQKLGSDARNVITAERARLPSADMRRLEAKVKSHEYEGYIAPHLSEIGEVHGADELELLNEYRRRYAAIVGELLVAKDRLIELEKTLRDQAIDEGFRRRMDEEIKELDEDCFARRPSLKRRSSEW